MSNTSGALKGLQDGIVNYVKIALDKSPFSLIQVGVVTGAGTMAGNKIYVKEPSVQYDNIKSLSNTIYNAGDVVLVAIPSSQQYGNMFILGILNDVPANIKSGSIQSSNYVANTSGLKIDLNNGTWDSKNFKVASNGSVTIGDGTLQSVNYVADTSGTKIDLSNGTIDTKNFKVNSTGGVTASDMNITGGSVNIATASDNTNLIQLNGTTGTIFKNATAISASQVIQKNIFPSGTYLASRLRAGAVQGVQVDSSGNETVMFSFNSNSGGGHFVTGSIQFYGTVLNSGGGTVFTSDRNAKEDIQDLDQEESSKFIYSLKPKWFRFKNGTSKRLHKGLIAPEVKDAMGKKDWGLYVDQVMEMENPTLNSNGELINEDGEIIPTKGLRYDELIADLIATVQTQNKRIEKLESMLSKESE